MAFYGRKEELSVLKEALDKKASAASSYGGGATLGKAP